MLSCAATTCCQQPPGIHQTNPTLTRSRQWTVYLPQHINMHVETQRTVKRHCRQTTQAFVRFLMILSLSFCLWLCLCRSLPLYSWITKHEHWPELKAAKRRGGGRYHERWKKRERYREQEKSITATDDWRRRKRGETNFVAKDNHMSLSLFSLSLPPSLRLQSEGRLWPGSGVFWSLYLPSLG